VNLTEAVEEYISRKRLMGRRYVNNAKELRAFTRLNADLPLVSVTSRHVLTFLNYRPLGRFTWQGRYTRLKAFFAYWLSRQQISRLPMPRPRRTGPRIFAPYIFPRSEIQALLEKAPEIQNRLLSGVRPETFRTLVILLYATGIWVSEALSLRLRDLDLENSVVTLSSRVGPPRQIPIGSDLTAILKQYLVASQSRDLLFTTKHNSRISTHRAALHFRRVRKLVGIKRTDGATRQPGLRDLRHTFAVHRVSDWYQNQANIELMLPRLAAYMGLRNFHFTERYLPLTPRHFRRQVRELSKGM
jgi:integrase/recombinase XerD